MEALFFLSSYLMVFIIPPQILDRENMPICNNFPGARLYFSAEVNRQKNNALFRKHYLDFLAFLALDKLSLPTGLTHQMVCWHIRDMRSESTTNLFGKHLANIWNCTSPHSDVFLTCFWEHMVPSTWWGKVTRTDNVSHDLLRILRKRNKESW